MRNEGVGGRERKIVIGCAGRTTIGFLACLLANGEGGRGSRDVMGARGMG